MLDAARKQQIAKSKFIAMLPKIEQGWKLLTFNDRIFALSPGWAPLVLHYDGWKEVNFTDADFQTEAGKTFTFGVRQAAKVNYRNKALHGITGAEVLAAGRVARQPRKALLPLRLPRFGKKPTTLH